MQRVVYVLCLILISSCSGRGKRAAIQQDPASTGPTSSTADESTVDSGESFDPIQPFAPDPTLDEEAINGVTTGGSDFITDTIEQSAGNAAAGPFADFFGSVSNDQDGSSGTATPDGFGADSESILDPSTGSTFGADFGDTLPLSGLNSLTANNDSLDLNSILNSISSTPSSGATFDGVSDGGGGASQILQMSQLFE